MQTAKLCRKRTTALCLGGPLSGPVHTYSSKLFFPPSLSTKILSTQAFLCQEHAKPTGGYYPKPRAVLANQKPEYKLLGYLQLEVWSYCEGMIATRSKTSNTGGSLCCGRVTAHLCVSKIKSPWATLASALFWPRPPLLRITWCKQRR